MALGRKLKKEVMAVLADENWESRFEELMDEYSMQNLVAPLFASLCATTVIVRWHGVTCFGKVISRMVKEDAPKARVVMRRIMWMLNEESGGCAWGVPEAMGEIAAVNDAMAAEYGKILLSYSHEDEEGPENYLEFPTLLRGAVWGVARMAQTRQEIAAQATDDLIRFLSYPDPVIQGTACWALGGLKAAGSVKKLEALVNNDTVIDIYKDSLLQSVAVGRLAQEALDRISGN
ncbi:DVU0298 family protein [Desulfovibrio sp. JC010]|uniref:DVU0298 family protein n=1 Tax=Desulfovibrio sp. JC010 TaxID=2593641 RepID=UPI0013D501DC|nr:DVU0298 family protein [Desulfovibrio sp. JC010]NDV26117.1 HEAT repeat domain-containing protein [Desulfovibrio sp. JC010]